MLEPAYFWFAWSAEALPIIQEILCPKVRLPFQGSSLIE